MSPRGRSLPVLLVAVSAISAAAVLVRLAPDVHPIAAGLWRTLAVAALLLPIALLREPGALRRVAPRDLALIAVAGALLAGHFWAWFASLHATTVLRSTVLVCLNPVWAGLFEWGLLRRNPGGRFWLGVAVAIAGVGLMTSQSAVAPSWTGDGLALLGGILGALYLVSGRVVRPRVGIDVYGTIVCGACALWLLPAALATGAELTGFSTAEWAVLAGLALGPQLLGHIGLNYAVRYLPAAIVAAVTLLEPAGAAALGGLVLDEWPSGRAWLGSAVAIGGVALATVRPRVSLNAETTP